MQTKLETSVPNRTSSESSTISECTNGTATQTATKATPTVNTLAARNEALLARLNARKKIANASKSVEEPCEEGAEVVDRICVERAGEVLDILIMLLRSRRRATFPLPELVKSVQTSVRSPLSKKEIVQCLKILAKGNAKNIAVSYTDLNGIENWTVLREGKDGMVLNL